MQERFVNTEKRGLGKGEGGSHGTCMKYGLRMDCLLSGIRRHGIEINYVCIGTLFPCLAPKTIVRFECLIFTDAAH